jgi:hypothetical protein
VRRWIRAVRERRLFSRVRLDIGKRTARQIAGGVRGRGHRRLRSSREERSPKPHPPSRMPPQPIGLAVRPPAIAGAGSSGDQGGTST